MDYYFEKSEFSSFENSLFHTPFHTRAQNEGMTGDKPLSAAPKKHQKMAIIRKKAISFSADGFGPSGESRTHGLLNPIQARYQTALHPDIAAGYQRQIIL